MTEPDPGASGPDPAASPPRDPAQPLPAAIPPVSLDLFRTGDRAAVAQYIARNAPLIRRRLRGKIARSLRGLFDSDDLMATISRRLDDIVRKRELTATSEGELWSLLEHLAANALSDLARRTVREHPDAPVELIPAPPASELEPKADSDDPNSLLAICLAEIHHEADQRILRMRLDHHTHAQIAAAEGVSESNVRKRWQRIRRVVRRLLGLAGPPPEHPRGRDDAALERPDPAVPRPAPPAPQATASHLHRP